MDEGRKGGSRLPNNLTAIRWRASVLVLVEYAYTKVSVSLGFDDLLLSVRPSNFGASPFFSNRPIVVCKYM